MLIAMLTSLRFLCNLLWHSLSVQSCKFTIGLPWPLPTDVHDAYVVIKACELVLCPSPQNLPADGLVEVKLSVAVLASNVPFSYLSYLSFPVNSLQVLPDFTVPLVAPSEE